MSNYPFVKSAAQYGTRKGPVKAFVAHMAEGGGTVGFLSRPNLRGVSVHYVIEYSGRIVQMLLESDASGSINPSGLRTTDDAATFGATVRKLVMGEWDGDPNSAIITVEIEGFAAAGPNVAQRAALVALVNDVRSRFPSMGLLGHRDFTDTKACPGKLIPWDLLGGHGPATGEPEVTITITTLPFGGRYTIKAGTSPTGIKIDAAGKVTGTRTRTVATSDYIAAYDATVTITSITGNPFLRCTDGFFAGYLVPASALEETPNTAPAPAPDTSPYTQAQLDAAVASAKAAEHERTRAAAIAAVQAIP